MNIQLSDHFTYKKLIRFTLPSIAMMILTSIYSVVDGFFVFANAGIPLLWRSLWPYSSLRSFWW